MAVASSGSTEDDVSCVEMLLASPGAGNIIVALTSTLILPVTSHRLIATNIVSPCRCPLVTIRTLCLLFLPASSLPPPLNRRPLRTPPFSPQHISPRFSSQDTALKRLGNLLATTMSAYAAVAAHAASSKPADAALPTEAASAIEGPSAATAPTTATLDPPQQPPDPVAAAQRLAEVLEAQGKVEQSLRGANAQIVPAQREWSFPAMRFAHWMEAQRSRHRRGGSGGLQGSLSRTLLDAEGDSRGDEGGSVRMVVSFGVPFPVKGLQVSIRPALPLGLPFSCSVLQVAGGCRREHSPRTMIM